MDAPEPPVDPIARLGESLRCLESRIDRLEKPAPPAEPKKKDTWEKAQILGSVLTPIVAGILARKIRDFISTKGLAMVQIRCLRGFETKSEAFA